MENRHYLDHAIAANFTNRLGEETLHVMRECFQAYRCVGKTAFFNSIVDVMLVYKLMLEKTLEKGNKFIHWFLFHEMETG